MAEHKPIVIINGRVQIIPAGDTLAASALPAGGGGSVSVAEVTVNFTSARAIQTFTVAVPGATVGQKVMAAISAKMPAGVDMDELEMDPLTVAAAVTAADVVTLIVTSVTGSRIRGQRNINLILG